MKKASLVFLLLFSALTSIVFSQKTLAVEVTNSTNQDSYFVLPNENQFKENLDLSESKTISYSITDNSIATSFIQKPTNEEFEFSNEGQAGIELTENKDLLINWEELEADSVSINLPKMTKNGVINAVNFDEAGNELSETAVGLLGEENFETSHIEPFRAITRAVKTDDLYNINFTLLAKGDSLPNTETKKVLSGQDAVYHMELKVTGSTKVYTNAQLVIEVPKQSKIRQNLSELMIADVVPKYDEVAGRLVYDIPVLHTGQIYRVNFGLLTANGTTANESLIPVKGTLTANEFNTIQKNAEIKVFSSLDPTVSIKVKEIRDSNNQLKKIDEGATKGDIIVWEMSSSIPKNVVGQRYFLEGTNIVVKSFLPKEVTYVTSSSNSNVEQHKTEHSIFWRTPVPSVQQQNAMTDYLFSSRVTFNTRVNDDIPDFKMLDNTARITVKDGDQLVKQVEDTTYVAVASGNEPPLDTDGTIFIARTYPPSLEGDWINYDSRPIKTMYDSGTFRVGISGGYAVGDEVVGVYVNENLIAKDKRGEITNRLVNSDLREISTEFKIGTGARIEELSIPVAAFYAYKDKYRPYSDKLPETFIRYVVNGQTKEKIINFDELDLLQPEDPLPEKTNFRENYNNPNYPVGMGNYVVSREYLNLKKEDVVSNIIYGYRNVKKGTTIRWTTIRFGITPGFTGRIKTHFAFNYIEQNGTKVVMKADASGSFSQPRSVDVVPIPPEERPIVETKIWLEKEEGNIVKEGSNTAHFTFKNDTSSLMELKGPFKSFILLARGVAVKQDTGTFPQGSYKKIDNNYQGSKRQLIEVEWDKNVNLLKHNQGFTGKFDVNVTNDSQNNFNLNIYSYANNSPLLKTHSGNGEAYSTSSQQTNGDLLNPALPSNHHRIHTIRHYQTLRDSQVVTSLQVKGELDQNYSKLGHTKVNGKLSYQLKLNNISDYKIHRFTLVEVLPSIGDLGITDNVQRGSKFTPKLTGPVNLPANLASKLNVFYSKSKNPKRNDLTNASWFPVGTTPMVNPPSAEEPNWIPEDRVTNWNEIGSFKLELKPNEVWQAAQEEIVTFNMRAPNVVELAGSNAYKPTVPEIDRTAWNSFAVTVNNLQPVEPERVGVVLEYSPDEITPGVLPNTGGTLLGKMNIIAIALMGLSVIGAGGFYLYSRHKGWQS